MPSGQIVGDILEGMGPGLLSGIGAALIDKAKEARPNNYDKGGEVKKTGLAIVHKGEVVTPKNETVKLSHHRVVMHLHKGGLHRALGIPEGEKIPAEKVEAATHSNNPHVRRMANLAQTMSHWHHK